MKKVIVRIAGKSLRAAMQPIEGEYMRKFSVGNVFVRFGGRLFFSRRHKSVRGSIVFIIANALLLASIVFFLEIILIFLGIGDFFIPLTHGISEFLSKVVFR